MPSRLWAYLALALASATPACSSPKARASGRIVVAVTVDWEGAAFSPDSLDALDELRKRIAPAPLTHFVSAAYFTKDHPDARAAKYIAEAVHPGDELALHLHAWRSLARASGIEPKLSPSFVTGTDKLYEFEDGDIGFDTDLDVYGVTELRALIRKSAQLREQTHVPVAKTFRSGGYLGTPKVLEALRLEGFTVDSSATDYRQIDQKQDSFLSRRVREVWPVVDTASQPYFVDPRRQLLEMPIAATADYVTAADVVQLVEAARAKLESDPHRDVFVVLGCNQETAQDFAMRIGEAIQQLRGRAAIADHLLLTTVDKAAAMARNQTAPPTS
ncbi:MAG TPA: hypothetical protein VK601_21735 [Kofleriaceae bacterium]|nr:hypothetical protein [Kofleriaceae bacterium]